MNEEIKLIVDENCDGKRLDLFISDCCEDISRSSAANLAADGMVLVNGKAKCKSYKLNFQDEVCFTVPESEMLNIQGENIPLDIFFEDDDLLVVNKPKGMVVHPAPGNYSGTLVNALMFHCKDSLSGINGIIRPGIVHRIDKDTSGLLIVAKNDLSHTSLAKQISEHSFTREYEAVVYGRVKQMNGKVDAPIGRNPKERKKMAVTQSNSRNAVTHYEVIEQFDKFAHIKLRLETGRTHQIRVHMAYIGHAVAGDVLYGPKKVIAYLNGQCLHAKKIGFIHPSTGEYMEFESPLPPYFVDFLNKI